MSPLHEKQKYKAINEYLKEIERLLRSGNATEKSYRTPLEQCLNIFLPQHIELIHESKQRKGIGAPDFILQHKTSKMALGCVETKNIGNTDLDGKKENRDQFNRYKDGLHNCIFTDYLTFVFYFDGKIQGEIRLAEVYGKEIRKTNKESQAFFVTQLETFTSSNPPCIDDAEKLAKRMAEMATVLYEIVLGIVNNAHTREDERIVEQKNDFCKILLPSMTNKEFADAYAQTITYGMLSASLEAMNTQFTLQRAGEFLPKTIPLIHEFFNLNIGGFIHSSLKWVVNAIAALFEHADLQKIMRVKEQAENPIIPFYEHFIQYYDKKTRIERGVWYTPAPIVRFMVRSLDCILKTEFNITQGLADNSKKEIYIKDVQGNIKKEEIHKVQILDPAAGSGTFLAEIIRHIHTTFKGVWNNYVENHLLPRLNGFEILIASYVMAHIQLGIQLKKETGYIPQNPRRFQVYLTNSMEEYPPNPESDFVKWLGEEATIANRIKKDIPIMCVIGNPPYYEDSKNNGDWIMELMEKYKKEPGGIRKLEEINYKSLNNDYVKFIRYGQYLIEKNKQGVLAFITPHGFLENPTFRGMRWNLLRTYDKIYILDVHGNANKAETASDGSKDENVFPIKLGVAISFFIKTGKKNKDELGKVYHDDLYGKQCKKYDYLNKNIYTTVPYKKITPQEPNYLFIPIDTSSEEEYNKGFCVTELFPCSSSGIVSARDHFTIHFTRKEVEQTIKTFLSLSKEEARAYFNLQKDTEGWTIENARADLDKNYTRAKGTFCNIDYHPFDTRWTYYTGTSKGFHGRPRGAVMRHFFSSKTNIGLCLCRQAQSSKEYAHVFITNNIVNREFISNKGAEGATVFPLYLFSEEDMHKECTPNLNKNIVRNIAKKLGLQCISEEDEACTGTTFTPMDILDYIYAILHSLAYRKTYSEFLKRDFPLVPYPNNRNRFHALVAIGKKLRLCHLFSEEIEKELTLEVEYHQGTHDHSIEKVTYNEYEERVNINSTQYFSNVPKKAWEYYIGGYRPAERWLKDRKGKSITHEDFCHYQKIIATLMYTDGLITAIDNV